MVQTAITGINHFGDKRLALDLNHSVTSG